MFCLTTQTNQTLNNNSDIMLWAEHSGPWGKADSGWVLARVSREVGEGHRYISTDAMGGPSLEIFS